VPPLPRISNNRAYLGTYYYLSLGHAQVKAAEYLGVGQSIVSKHALKLVGEGYLKKVPGSRSPKLYCKGMRANVLDDAIFQSGFHFDGGTVKPTEVPQVVNGPKDLHVSTARTHINGRVSFVVNRIGDMTHLKIPVTEGRTISMPLFPKEPYKAHHNVRQYKTKLPYDGKQVSIEFLESDKEQYLYVWPYQKMLTPDELTKEVEQVFIEEAQRIVNDLSKYGGWQFGIVQFVGDVEIASTDPAILSMIPEDMKRVPGSPFWVDESEGPREIETTDPEAARILFNIKNVVKDLQNGQSSLTDKYYVLEVKADRMLAILEKFALVIEKDAEITAGMLEKDLANTAEKIKSNKAEGATARQSNYGGMYQ